MFLPDLINLGCVCVGTNEVGPQYRNHHSITFDKVLTKKLCLEDVEREENDLTFKKLDLLFLYGFLRQNIFFLSFIT